MIRLVLLLSVLLMAACALRTAPQLPAIVAGDDRGAKQRCDALFPSGSWQFVHSIDFSATRGFAGTLLGVTVIDAGSLRCALLTVEGVTLFEAVLDAAGELQIIRAVAPFTSDGFAAGLLADVHTIFVAPAGELLPGRLADGSAVCRSRGADSRITEVFPAPDGYWQLRAADGAGTIETVVTGHAGQPAGGIVDSATIELRSYQQGGYRLTLGLIEATPLRD